MKKFLYNWRITNLADTPFEGFGPNDWAMYFIEHYGQVDGSHHKAWVLDQVARILKGTEIEVIISKWSDGSEEFRVMTGEPSQAYTNWSQDMLGEIGEDGKFKYCYGKGIAP